jgi:hypothetical protein
MKLSNHAKVRCQQRGIPNKLIKMVIIHGKPERGPGGARIYLLSKKMKNQIISSMKQNIQVLEQASNVKVVVSDDEQVITAYHYD